MFYIVDEIDRKDRTWEEICRDFPESNVAIDKPHRTDSSCTGGIVIAHAVRCDADSAGEVMIYTRRNDLVYSCTFPERSVLIV